MARSFPIRDYSSPPVTDEESDGKWIPAFNDFAATLYFNIILRSAQSPTRFKFRVDVLLHHHNY